MKYFYKLEEGTPREHRIIISAISLAGFIVFFDQLTKMMIVEGIPLYSRYPVIPGFFDITYVTNTGAAWGMLAGKSWLLLIVSIAVFTVIACFLKQICEGWTERYYGLLMIMGGIIGNSIDRIFRGGAVVDFLRFHWDTLYEFPSFNIADSAITAGVFFFILSILFRPESKQKNDGSPAKEN